AERRHHALVGGLHAERAHHLVTARHDLAGAVARAGEGIDHVFERKILEILQRHDSSSCGPDWAPSCCCRGLSCRPPNPSRSCWASITNARRPPRPNIIRLSATGMPPPST